MSRFPKRPTRRTIPVPTRRLRGRVGVAAALATIASLLASGATAAPAADESDVPEQATNFRIATFNILGAGHTDKKKADRPNFAKSDVRMGYTVRLLRKQSLGIVGFQELQAPQLQEFRRLTGEEYGVFPGDTFGPLSAPMHNSIAWRRSEWTLLEADTLAIPYGFKRVNGKKVVSRIQMPVLLLQSNATGQQVWVSNFHNAAKVVGPQSHRDEARALQIALVKRLRAESPTVPVFVLGDLNETDKVFCQFQRKAPLQAAGPGGTTASGSCVPPRPIGVDWIFGTTDVTFSDHARLRTRLVRKASDHPLVVSNVYVAPAREQASPVRRVVTIAVDGLRASYVRKHAGRLPALARMMREGASTTRAHTIADSTKSLPNQISTITGRPKGGSGGHGVRKERLKGTVHKAAGHYVPSMFDVVHDAGRSTAVLTDDKTFHGALGSWTGRHGARDGQGLDNGSGKLSVRAWKPTPKKVVTAARKRLKRSPDALTHLQLHAPDVAGHRKGFGSGAWKRAVADVDKQVGRLLKLVSNDSRLRGSTLVVLTAGHGGEKRAHKKKSSPHNHTVPFLVWGPGVGLPPGSDLFTLNPHLTVSAEQVPNAVPTVRNASLPNVALTALRLPSVPGSGFGWSQHVSWRPYAG